MKPVIVRNANYKNHSSFHRSVKLLNKNGIEKIMIIDRNRNALSKKVTQETIVETDVEITLVTLDLNKGDNFLTKVINIFMYQIMLFSQLRKNRKDFDFVYAYDLDAGLVALMLKKFYKIAYVYHIADFYADSRKTNRFLYSFIKRLEFWVMKNSSTSILCTEPRKKQIAGYTYNNIEVIHNIPVFDKSERVSFDNIAVSSEVLTISYVGGLTSVRFIKQVLKVVSEMDKVKLKVAGFGPLENVVKDYADKYSNIEFVGKIDYANTLDLYKATDIILAMYNPKVKNHLYSAPNKLYEAMFLAKAIIVANNTGTDEVVLKYDLGYVCDYEINAFKALLESILADKDKLLEKSKNAFKAHQHFDLDSQALIMKKVLKGLDYAKK